MAFTTMARFRVGYWRAVRNFLLRERQDISKRLLVLDLEIAKIGRIDLEYQSMSDPLTGEVKRSEHRVGIKVTPNSSLEKLLRAYIAQGGSPLDISQFFHPGESTIVGNDANGGPIYNHKYPHGGVAAPVSRDYDTTNEVDPERAEDMPSDGFGENPGGYLNLVRYAPRRLGGRKDLSDEHAVIARLFHQVRAWCNQEIRDKVQMLEYRILKLCDLREQLENERDIVLQSAFGGLIDGLTSFDSELFAEGLRVQSLIADVDKTLFLTDAQGNPVLNMENEVQVSALEWAYPDDDTEALIDLMA